MSYCAAVECRCHDEESKVNTNVQQAGCGCWHLSCGACKFTAAGALTPLVPSLPPLHTLFLASRHVMPLVLQHWPGLWMMQRQALGLITATEFCNFSCFCPEYVQDIYIEYNEYTPNKSTKPLLVCRINPCRLELFNCSCTELLFSVEHGKTVTTCKYESANKCTVRACF